MSATALEQLGQLKDALQTTLINRSGLYDQMEANDKNVAGIQNTLQGIELGKKIAAEEATIELEEANRLAEQDEPVDPITE